MIRIEYACDDNDWETFTWVCDCGDKSRPFALAENAQIDAGKHDAQCDGVAR